MHSDHVDLVHVRRDSDGTPAVVFCDSFRMEGSESLTLARLRKTLKLDRYRCTTLLPCAQYQLHQIDAPPVPPAELKAAVRWRMKDIIDYPVDAATVEILHIPGDPSDAHHETSLYAVTARSDAVADAARPFDESQIHLDAIDIPDLAQRNIAALFEHEDTAVAMVAFYEHEGLLTFTRGGELLLSRRIEIPLDALTPKDADERREAFEGAALEVQRSLDHFEYQFRHVAIPRVMLAPLAGDDGLAQVLSTTLPIPVEPLDLGKVVDFDGVPELRQPAAQAQYLRLIGAALREDATAA